MGIYQTWIKLERKTRTNSMRLITTIALALLGVTTWAQTSLPDLPTGALRYSQTLWLVPSDSTLWTGSTGNYAQVATREQLRQLSSQGYTKSQVDSAITSQIGLIDFPVTSVAGKTGDVELDASDVGLGNVDNTTDLDKPISTATQGALDGKENAFSKGSLVAGTGVTLSGTLANRLVGSGNVTINSTSSLTASNGLQINSGVISPVYGTAAGTVAQGNDSRIIASYNYSQIGHLPLTGGTLSDGTSNPLTLSRATNQVSLRFLNDTHSIFLGTTSSGELRTGISGDLNTTGNTIWHSGNLNSFTRTVSGLVPSPGGSGTTRYLREDGSWVDPSSGGGGGTATDLSIANRNANTLQIGSSTGTNATVPAATTSLSGLMTAADKSALNSAITSESDPTVPAHVKAITSGQIENWNTAYGWGDYRLWGLGNESLTSVSPESAWDVTRGTSFIRSGSTANSPFPQAGSALHIAYLSTGGANQLFFGQTNDGVYFRRQATSGVWGPVRTIWHDGNFTPSDYLLTSNFTWSNLIGKPSTFAPSPHSHSAADINSGTLAAARIPTLSISKISGLQSALDAKATSGTAGSQVRTNTQLDARYVQSIGAGSGISVSGTTVSVDNTVVRTSGSQSISGNKTFNSPTVAPQYQGTSTTASSSIPTNAQSLFKATISSNTNYTLTNLSGNPRQIQVMVTNTSGSTVYVNFSGGSVRMADGATDNVPASATVIFTFLIENGTAWGVKSTFL